MHHPYIYGPPELYPGAEQVHAEPLHDHAFRSVDPEFSQFFHQMPLLGDDHAILEAHDHEHPFNYKLQEAHEARAAQQVHHGQTYQPSPYHKADLSGPTDVETSFREVHHPGPVIVHSGAGQMRAFGAEAHSDLDDHYYHPVSVQQHLQKTMDMSQYALH